MPDAFPLKFESGGQYRISELAEWFTADLTELAARFDARNGNDFFQRRIGGVADLKMLVRSIPVPKRDDESRYAR